MCLCSRLPPMDFNPRSPCGERPFCCPGLHSAHFTFQSTLPVWGATLGPVLRGDCDIISIHAPRVGSDQTTYRNIIEDELFQSTLPVWGATAQGFATRSDISISIHAPRVGSDTARSRKVWRTINFNPRSPCGERLYFPASAPWKRRVFQSTLPVWGATGHV